MWGELKRADRIVILWSAEYKRSFERSRKGGVAFEMTIVLKRALIDGNFDRVVSCVTRSNDRKHIDDLWRDQSFFVVPQDTSRLVAHLRGERARVTERKVVTSRSGKVVRASQKSVTPPARLSLSFEQSATTIDAGRCLDVLGALRSEKLQFVGEGRSFVEDLLSPMPPGERSRALELYLTRDRFYLRRYPGHGRNRPFGELIPEGISMEFSWRLSPGASLRALGRVHFAGSVGTILLGREFGPPLIQVVIRDLAGKRIESFNEQPASTQATTS
jgi:hypothetical protein